MHTLHYIWDRVGDESSVLSGTMSLAKMPIISLFSQPLSSFKILQAYSLQQQFQSAKRPIVLRPLLAVFVRNFSEIGYCIPVPCHGVETHRHWTVQLAISSLDMNR